MLAVKEEEPPHPAGGRTRGSGSDLSSTFVKTGIRVSFHQLRASPTLQIGSRAAVSLRGGERNKPGPLFVVN